MNRTRIIFISIIVAALLIVGATVLLTNLSGTGGAALTVEKPEAVTIRILASLPVETCVRSAADSFQAEQSTVDG